MAQKGVFAMSWSFATASEGMDFPLQRGVLVGCDHVHEWLLPWFYSHFRNTNSCYPIAFADFGMSENALQWCRKRGEVYAVSAETLSVQPFLYEGEQWIARSLKKEIEPHQRVLFKKPFALQNSPFSRTLWLDLDCQVRGDLTPLFSMELNALKFAASPTGSKIFVNNLSTNMETPVQKYNTGIILYEKDSPLLQEWVELIRGRVSFTTDEGSLSFLISRQKISIVEIGYEIHWTASTWGEKNESLIYHYMGQRGKQRIKQLIAERLLTD